MKSKTKRGSAIYFRWNYLMNLFSLNLQITSNPSADFSSRETSKYSNIETQSEAGSWLLDFLIGKTFTWRYREKRQERIFQENGEKIIQYRDSGINQVFWREFITSLFYFIPWHRLLLDNEFVKVFPTVQFEDKMREKIFL